MSRAGRAFKAIKGAFQEATGISDTDKARLISQFEDAYQNEPPPTIAIIGEAGVGKTTTLNALFNAGAAVGHSTPTTKVSDVFQLQIFDHQGNKGTIRVIDLPGLGESIQKADEILGIYRHNLPCADAILWVHPVNDRMLEFVQRQISTIFAGKMRALLDRLVFGLNKADSIYPSDWKKYANIPSESQLINLDKAEHHFTTTIASVLPERYTPRVVTYSALRRYQLPLLFRLLMEAMPATRRWVLEARMDIADFKELADPQFLSAFTDQACSAPQHSPDRRTIVNSMKIDDLRKIALEGWTPEEWWRRQNR